LLFNHNAYKFKHFSVTITMVMLYYWEICSNYWRHWYSIYTTCTLYTYNCMYGWWEYSYIHGLYARNDISIETALAGIGIVIVLLIVYTSTVPHKNAPTRTCWAGLEKIADKLVLNYTSKLSFLHTHSYINIIILYPYHIGEQTLYRI